MTAVPLQRLVRQLRQTAESRQFDHAPDAELLERFHTGGDPEAFASIVRRHGAGVLAACRRVLPSEADVEDAFQATFLVLLRNAQSIRRRHALAAWLSGVAHRVALKALAAAARRRRAERREPPAAPEGPDLSWREACAILHEELDRLPETYRLPLLLCYLEGKSRDEAARQLGLKTDTVRGRLERGRDRLRGRLTKRGVTLSAGLLAVLHRAAEAADPPARLVQVTAEMIASGRTPEAVAALALGGASSLFGAKCKLLAALVVFAGLVAGVVGSRPPVPAAPPPAAKAEARPPAPKAPEKPADEDTITVAGRVLGPDGRPIRGAKLFIPRLKNETPRSEDDIDMEQAGTSEAEGRFQLTFKNPFRRHRGYVIAHADGFGVDWVELTAGKPAAEVVLKLVKDQPITGRILDTEGKPLVGVAVGVAAVYVPEKERLDDYLAAWKKNWRETVATPVKRLYLPLDASGGSATTDRDGRFKLTGAGAERVVHVSVRGRGTARLTPYFLTRAGLDPKPYNEAALAQESGEFRIKGQLPILYGPESTLVVEAGRLVEGVVKDLATGKPLADFRVGATFGFGDGVQAVTDADGKYRLEGLPQDKNYRVYASAPQGSPYLRRSGEAEAPPGNAPVRIDIQLAKGVVVSGRVIDRQTGKGVESGIRFAPLPDNKHFGKPGLDAYRTDRTMQGTDREGRFRVVTIPGKSLLMVQTHGREQVDGEQFCPYLTARPDPDYKDLFKYEKDDDTWLFTSASGGLEFLNIENVVKVVDLKEDGDEVKVELFVERGKTAQVVFRDADGKPLSGVVASGVTAHWPIAFRLKTEGSATVYALDPERPRRLAFLHPEKQLGGTVTLRGDEKEPVVVKLAPLGAVTARFLEIEGAPLAGAEISVSSPDRVVSELYRHLGRSAPPVKTDKEGRFTLPDVVPGVKFYLQTQKGNAYYVGEPKIGLREVEPGKTLDLGERKLKPQN